MAPQQATEGLAVASEDRSESRSHAYWLAARGARQGDLAERFAAEAQGHGLRVLALKGIAIADQLYDGAENRPMADIDFLVVDTARFAAAGGVARSLGLLETGASDHALVFKEPFSAVVIELHLSLTACPGLFSVDPEALWERRAPVPSTAMFRLGDADLVVHLALHLAFQHAFTANEYHYGDFERALHRLRPSLDDIVMRAREWGALSALGATARVSALKKPDSSRLAEIADLAGSYCPRQLSQWIDARPELPPPFSLAALAFVRYHLAPSKWRYLHRTLFPRTIPGRTLPRAGVARRLASLVDAGVRPPSAHTPSPVVSLPERVLPGRTADDWIRDCLSLEAGVVCVTVSGACMEPSLRPGERITLRKSLGLPRVGEVTLLRTPRGLRLHRVVFRFRRMIRTKGDRSVFLDPQVSERDVLAVWESDEAPVVSSVRVGLSLSRLLKRPFTSEPGSDLPGDEAHSDSCDDAKE